MHQNYARLQPTSANYVPLSPLSFLSRAATCFKTLPAVEYGNTHYDWGTVASRVRAFSAALKAFGIGKGDTVSVLSPNIPAMFELHYAVPLARAVLNTINIRLEVDTVAYILEHSDCKLLIIDSAFGELAKAALTQNGCDIPVVEIVDLEAGMKPAGIGLATYEQWIDNHLDNDIEITPPEDEWDAITLSYTSGTSGRPKGVVYHHRGAYLMSMGTAAAWAMPVRASYLSIVPMFHCNGWNHPWAIAIIGGKMVFTRDPLPEKIFAAITRSKVTHFGAAPIILSMLAESEHTPEHPFEPPIKVLTAGAPPPPAVLERAAAIGLEVMQVYGLTETYGHITQCVWQPDWAELPASEQAQHQAKQGIAFPMVEQVSVMDRDNKCIVPADGETQGEIVIRGNTVMKGYYKNEEATADSFDSGYFWSGDAAILYEDGYIRIKDRLKDVIISGGENISSVELEAVLHRHPDVQLAAVVAMPHPKWGESPCAFLELKPNAKGDESEMISFCKSHLAGFKVPKKIIFSELPKTATGKVQKFKLREQAKTIIVD